MIDKKDKLILHSSDFMNFNKYSNPNGQNQINSLNLKFDTVKPIELISDLIKLKKRQANSIILDFFAGSGTTGHAVMDLNQKDNGKRKFILCTNNENHIAYDVTYERLHRIIKGSSFKSKEDQFKDQEKNKVFKNEKLRVINIWWFCKYFLEYKCWRKKFIMMLKEVLN